MRKYIIYRNQLYTMNFFYSIGLQKKWKKSSTQLPFIIFNIVRMEYTSTIFILMDGLFVMWLLLLEIQLAHFIYEFHRTQIWE